MLGTVPPDPVGPRDDDTGALPAAIRLMLLRDALPRLPLLL